MRLSKALERPSLNSGSYLYPYQQYRGAGTGSEAGYMHMTQISALLLGNCVILRSDHKVLT